jgi:VWFA-related protein
MKLRFWFGILLAMGLQPPCAAAQPVRERVSVGVVTISLTAQTSSGKPVRDLALEDLSLRVDGQPVRIDSLTGSGRVTSRREPAPVPRAQENRPSAVTASEAAFAPAAEPEQVAVLIDEGGSNSNDRRDVYRLLGRYLRDSVPADQTIMVARSDGMKLDVLVPWTQKSGDVDAALGVLTNHPARPRIVSPHEITTLRGADLMGLKKEVLFARERLFRAMLYMLASFPPAPARRTLVLVTSGTALLSPPDFATLAGSAEEASQEESRGFREDPGFKINLEMEQARTAFELWSDASRRGWYSQLADVMAKAQEKNVALVSINAEALERGTNPGVDGKWPSRAMPGLLRGGSGLSARLPVGQTMTTMAIQTGGEAILLPLKTADQLSNFQSLAPYQPTFRDPFSDDHRHHRVEIATTRRDVTLRYRRGYRSPTEEEDVLDGLMVRLGGPAPAANPLAANVVIARSPSSPESPLLHLTCRFEPPRERGGEAEQERSVEVLVAAMDDSGRPSDPAKWAGTARRIGSGASFAADFDLNLPPRAYRWSIALRDGPTGLVSYVKTESRP